MRDVEELKRISDEEKQLQEQLLAVNRKMLSLISRKHAIQSRAEETFKRGSEIVESDPSHFSGDTGDINTDVWSPSLDVDWANLDPNLLVQAGQDFVGGTAGASPGSSETQTAPTS
jgi:hypothetical protein